MLLFLPVVHGCWLYSKENMVNKIDKLLNGRDVSRAYIKELERKLPKAVSWAIGEIGIETAFTDCDENKDGIITVNEMRDMDTCMASCVKLGVLNMVL